MDLDFDYDASTKVRSRGTSSVIELDIAYMENRHSIGRPSGRASIVSGGQRSSRKSGLQQPQDEMCELGETLERLTAEYGNAFCVHVDEDGCPDKPPDMPVFRNPYLKTLCRSYREALRPALYRYVTLNFRFMRRNAPMYVGYLVTQKGVRRSDLYKAEYLPIWTHCIRVRMRANVKIGVIFHGLKSRLGLQSVVGLHFCVDGFFGMEAFGDAFGNAGSGICPWMELSSNGSAKSLRLMDGDNIYVSEASERMQQTAHACKQRANRRHSTMANAMTLTPAKDMAQDLTDFEKHPLEL